MDDDVKDDRIKDLEDALRLVIDADVGCGCCSTDGHRSLNDAISNAEAVLDA